MSKIKYLYLRTDFAQLEIRTSTSIIRNNALHDSALIKLLSSALWLQGVSYEDILRKVSPIKVLRLLKKHYYSN